MGGLKELLLKAGEKAEADKGYRGEPEVIDLPEEGFSHLLGAKARARMRHETCNKRFNDWGCMAQIFRHDVALHSDCMHVITVLTRLAIENGKPLFMLLSKPVKRKKKKKKVIKTTFFPF